MAQHYNNQTEQKEKLSDILSLCDSDSLIQTSWKNKLKRRHNDSVAGRSSVGNLEQSTTLKDSILAFDT